MWMLISPLADQDTEATAVQKSGLFHNAESNIRFSISLAIKHIGPPSEPKQQGSKMHALREREIQ